MCVPAACRGQEKVSDPIHVELWMVVSCHKGAENQTQVFCRISKYPYLLSHLFISIRKKNHVCPLIVMLGRQLSSASMRT